MVRSAALATGAWPISAAVGGRLTVALERTQDNEALVPHAPPVRDISAQRLAAQPTSRWAQSTYAANDFRSDVIAALRSILGGTALSVFVEYNHVRCLIVDIRAESHGLSPRELEIARLVAHGATNRAIGTTLDISLWTVSTHLRRVFAKLGVSSRAEMVANLFSSPRLQSDL